MASELPLEEFDRVAAQLARLSGTAIEKAFLTEDASFEKGQPNDRVELRLKLDDAIERMVWERLDALYDKPSVIGEQLGCRYSSGQEVVWVIDPIDATDNFLQGFPIFATSIGVLRRGEPVAGAIWCSCSHTLRSGVYSAHLGSAVSFQGKPIAGIRPIIGKRRLAVAANLSSAFTSNWAIRRSGSAVWECAFLAAGIFEVVHFPRAKIWDIAAGMALARAAGLKVYSRGQKGWRLIDHLPIPEPEEVDRGTQEFIIGTSESAKRMCDCAVRYMG